MVKEVTVKLYRCKCGNCGYRWTTRFSSLPKDYNWAEPKEETILKHEISLPKICPKCKSRRWNSPSLTDPAIVGAYHSWHGARNRCYQQNNPNYPNYGLRGIT